MEHGGAGAALLPHGICVDHLQAPRDGHLATEQKPSLVQCASIKPLIILPQQLTYCESSIRASSIYTRKPGLSSTGSDMANQPFLDPSSWLSTPKRSLYSNFS